MAHAKRRSIKNKKVKVLFTGNGVRMIDNLMKHISSPFESDKCSADEGTFSRALNAYSPHIIVICLQDEYPNDLKVYYILEDNPKYENIQVLAIGRDEDCELFQKKITLKNAVVMGRPLNMDLFMPTMEKMANTALSFEPDEEEEESSQKNNTIESKEKNTAAARNSTRQSILVVDDDVLMLNTIKLYLEDLYDVTVVPSGKLALKFLSKKHADLVLLDYLMPEMDGPEVLEQIRTSSSASDIPVLFLTGVADKDLVMKSLDHIPNGYLLKPVTRELLLERVTEILLGL